MKDKKINGMSNARYIAACLLSQSNLEGDDYYKEEDIFTKTIEEALLNIEQYDSAFSVNDLAEMDYSKEFIEQVFELPNDIKYMAVEDYQGGSFCFYRLYGIRDWYCQELSYDYMNDIEYEDFKLPQSHIDCPNMILDNFQEIYSVRLEPVGKVLYLFNLLHKTNYTSDDLSDEKIFDTVADWYAEKYK